MAFSEIGLMTSGPGGLGDLGISADTVLSPCLHFVEVTEVSIGEGR